MLYVPPLQLVFRIVFIELSDWILILLISFIATFWMEIVKIVISFKDK
ncbi:MAG: cation transporting ATPase C-terminal domain-containing protein [Candidatus Hermodarchaeota archaeon]